MPPDFAGRRLPLYTAEYATDPHRDMLRRFGSLAPVELAPGISATLVIGYHTALRILNDPDRFTSDPRAWEQNIPADCPIRPMMEWYPNPLHSGGSEGGSGGDRRGGRSSDASDADRNGGQCGRDHTSNTNSTSTAEPRGSSARPTADRACLPTSPNTSPRNFDEPSITCGC